MAIASLAVLCKDGNAASGKAGVSTAEAIAAYEGTAEAARDPAEKEVEVPKDMKLVLLVGQSNMSGRAPVTDEFKKPIDRCYKLNRDGKWALATNPFHFDRKSELGLDAKVPVIVGEIGRWMRKDGDHAAKVNPAIHECANRVVNCACVSAEGLKNQDPHHFDGPSVKALGDRYYEAWKSQRSAIGSR